MKRRKALIALVGVVALLAVVAACESSQPAPDGPVGPLSPSSAGIWVTGQASVTVEPDLVLLTVGVETTGETVAEARAAAAGAMDAVVKAVKAHGLEDRDVQTQSFNIWPRYEYPEVMSGEMVTRKQVLVGYTVSNMARIKARDVDGVGAVIDDAAEAGGDATRIHGIDFTIEDPKPFMAQLREEAVADARAKAEHLASLSEVTLGELVYVGEAGAAPPPGPVFADAEGMAMTNVMSTSISGGELELGLSVQAGFVIR